MNSNYSTTPVTEKVEVEKVKAFATAKGILEDELIQRVRNHDEEAMLCFYDCYAAPVFTMLCKILPTKAIAEEVLQQTFVHACNKANDYNGKTSVKLWVINIGRNLAIETLCSINNHSPGEEANKNPNFKNKKSIRLLESKSAQNFLFQLNSIERTVIVLAYYCGFTCNQTSEFLKVPLVTAEKKLQLAYRKLRMVVK